jgi:short-subunit dehydrogenase
MTTLNGKIVLLTGASRGIGRFIASALAQEQAIVVGVARSQPGLDHLCDGLRTFGAKGYGIAWDLADIASLPNLVKRVEAQVGPVDILINNAGIEKYQAFQDYSLDDLQTILNVNLLAAMELTRLVLPPMVQRQSGHIVNMASTAAKKGHPFDSAYSASKAGLLMWGDALRQELAQTGVAVSVLCPGYVNECGMLADTGIPAPKLAGTSSPIAVAQAVIQAIQHNQAEVILNQDALSATISKLFFALGQFAPRWGDALYRAIGVPQLNQLRIQRSLDHPPLAEPLVEPTEPIAKPIAELVND